MYENIRNTIDNVIQENTPEAVLFSGGIDSSAILYNANKYNPNVMGITVGVKGKENSDIEYSKMVANKLGIKNHQIFYVEPQKVKDMVETSVKILKSFNPEWVSSTTTLLLGTMYAKKAGVKSISSGEGADDLLGSFSFFKNWNGDYSSLDKAIKDRLDEIVIMSDIIAQSMNMEYIAPFHDNRVKKVILDVPIEERMKEEGEIKTKYPLRKAYEGILPQDCIVRPQTMAFAGSGVYETIRSISDDISDEEYHQACENIMKFKSKFEYALFKIYEKNLRFQQQEQGGCIHCKSSMGGNKINCKVCATLQIDGKELEFDGNDNDEKAVQINGAEGIVMHNGKIVLGMQQPKRWYELENGEKAAIIKTIGGKIEEEDNNSSKEALIRETLEEIKGIQEDDIKVSEVPIFSKSSQMSDLNPYDRNSNLNLNADFYVLEILNKKSISPNDLPALVEINIDKLLQQEFAKSQNLSNINDDIIKNEGLETDLPQNYALMIPEEVKNFLQKYIDDIEK